MVAAELVGVELVGVELVGVEPVGVELVEVAWTCTNLYSVRLRYVVHILSSCRRRGMSFA